MGGGTAPKPNQPPERCPLRQLNGAVVIAVTVVCVVQMTVDKIVDMIPVGDRLMAAVGAVRVPGFMAAAPMPVRATGGILGRNVQLVLVDVIAVHVVKMPVVQVVDVISVLNSRVAAAGAVLVRVVVVDDVSLSHKSSL
jgi:hypothetical protein